MTKQRQSEDQMVSQGKGISRRRVLGGAAGGALALAGLSRAGAAPRSGGMPAVIRSADKPVEIIVSHIWATPPGTKAGEESAMQKVIDAFNATNTGVKATSRVDAGDYATVLQKAQAEIAAGKPPAIVSTPWSNLYFATQGLGLVSLEKIAGNELDQVLKESIKPTVINLVQVNGETVGMPWGLSTPIVYYNADMFKKAGVDPATAFKDWPGFAEGAKTLLSKNPGVPVIAFTTNKDWPAQGLAQSNGGHILDANGKPVMDSAETVAAMQMVQDLDKAKLYDHSTGTESWASYLGGSLACSVSSSGGTSALKNVTFTAGTVPFPVFPGKPRKNTSGGSFLGVYARDKDQQQAAWEFLKFAVSKDGYSIWNQQGYLNISTYDLPILPGQEAAYTQLKEGITPETAWPGPRGAEIQTTWGNYVSRIWASDIGAEEGCKDAVKDIKPLLP